MSWPMVKLRDVLSIIRGVTFKPNNLVEPLSEGSTMVMRTKNVQRSGLDISDLIAIPDSFIKRDEQYLCSEDMLISSANSWDLVGKISFIEKLPAKATAGGFISIIRAKKEKITPKYLYYWLTLEQTQEKIRNCGQKTTNISNLNLERFKELLIPLPSLDDQRRIADILDKAAGICQKREKAIKLADDFLRATFLKMFGDPVSNSKGWKVKPLNELSVKIASGSTPKGGSKVYVDKGIIFFRSQNVWKNDIRLDDIAYIDEKTHNSLKKSSLKHKDILITKTGRFNTDNSSLGRAALFLGDDDSANVNGHVYLIRLKEGMSHEFIVFILTSNEYREHIRDVCVGGIDKRQLNKEHIENFPIICPPDDLQMDFMRTLNSIQKIRSNAMSGLKKVTTLFNTLSQNGFSDEFLKVGMFDEI